MKVKSSNDQRNNTDATQLKSCIDSASNIWCDLKVFLDWILKLFTITLIISKTIDFIHDNGLLMGPINDLYFWLASGAIFAELLFCLFILVGMTKNYIDSKSFFTGFLFKLIPVVIFVPTSLAYIFIKICEVKWW